MFDTLIRNGTVIDGTGRLRYEADVGISDGKIETIGHLEYTEAARTVDGAGGLAVVGQAGSPSRSRPSVSHRSR